MDFITTESIISKKRNLVVYTKIDNHIEHNYDEHSMDLQKSKYIKIDDDFKNFQFRKKSKGEEEIVMKLRFCKSQDVDRKFKKLLIYKTKFLTKMQHMKVRGKKIEIMSRLDKWFG